ncbi:prepilin-type N-terminal cleavage/methylation domain-containing protein [bacterium]|nr:prepilin-type N-terminal cleavage/methylation domain-containing protein [bacterium]
MVDSGWLNKKSVLQSAAKWREGGFTLVEVMVAVALITAMSLTSYSVLNGSLNAKKRLEKKEERLHGVRVSLNKLAEDLTQAFVADPSFAGTENYYKTYFQGKRDELKFSGFVHYHFMENAKDSDQALVRYFTKTSSDRDLGLVLRRSETAMLVPDTEKDPRDFEVMSNIKKITFTYYDAEKEDWVSDWDSEKASNLGKLPRAVKIEITVAEADGNDSKEFDYKTIALINNFNAAISF